MNSVYLEDLAITVKTTKKCRYPRNQGFHAIDVPTTLTPNLNTNLDHHSRLLDVIDTWFEDAPVNVSDYESSVKLRIKCAPPF